jgi:3-hydroxyisobutyrate dehydrogenase-like beta-hydroxyacid dehydrogenase
VRQQGARYLESPFTGSRPAAEERQSVFYLGGEKKDIEAAEIFLARLSQVRLPIGTPGQAASLKLAMNLNLAIMMQGLSESVTYSRRAGIDDETYWKAFAKNAGYSPLAKLKEPKIKAGNFDPQFSVKHMHKDLRLALSESRGDGLPLLAATLSRLGELMARHEGDLDFSALLKLFPAPKLS